MNEYTHLEITKKVNDLIDNLDQDEFNSYDELTEYIYESFN